MSRHFYPKLFLFIALQLWSLALQANVQKVLSVSKEQTAYPVQSYFTYFIDNTNSLGITKIASPLVSPAFVSWNENKGAFNTGFTSGTVWLKLWLQNTDVIPVNLIWGLESDIDTAVLYELTELTDSLTAIVGPKSVLQPLRERDPKVRTIAFNIHLDPGKAKVLYVEIINKNDLLNIPMQLAGSRFFLENETRSSLRYGLFLGLFLCISFINILIFVAVREGVFIWYGSYVLAVFIYMVTDSYYDGFLFPDWLFTFLNHFSRMGIIFLVFATQLGMVMELLDVKKTSSKLYFYMQILLYALFNFAWVSAVLNNYRYALPAGPLLILFGVGVALIAFAMLGIVAILYEKVKTKNDIVIIYIFSYLPLLVATINRLLLYFNHDFLGQLDALAVPIGLLAQIAGLGVLVVYRFYIIYQDRKNLIADKRERELKVAGEIIAAQETERHRIARDLHDDLGARLGSLKYKLANNPLYIQQPGLWHDLEQTITSVSASLRNISHGLIDNSLEKEPLSQVLKALVHETGSQSGINFQLILEGDADNLPVNYRLGIYRIISECINNILKHSKATEATVQLLVNAHIMLMIEDNGQGFNNDGNFSGIGLKNMQNRVLFLNGTIKIDSGAKGTTIIIEIPKP